MPPPTPPTTTPPIVPVAGVGLPPDATTVSQATPEPTAIGVPKYQTVGGRYVFKGTKYAQVMQSGDGKYYAIDQSGNFQFNPDGTPAEDTPATDKSGNPIRLPAQYTAPVGTPVNTPAGVTSRIQPGSMGAASALSGPAKYNEGDEVAILAGMPAEARQQIQLQMVDRGLAPTNAVAPGGYDGNWANAFKQVLAFANANNMTYDQALQAMPIVDRTSTATVQRNHYNITLSSPQTLEAIFKKTASDMLGGTDDVPQGFVDGMVRAYQEMQRQDAMAQIKDKEAAANEPKKRITVDENGNPIPTPGSEPGTDISGALPDSAATASGPGASPIPAPAITTSTALPSAAQYAQDQLMQQAPGRYRATQIAQQYDVFSRMLSSIGGGNVSGTTGTAPTPQGDAGHTPVST